MAIKKIEIRPESSNDYADILYPKTSADQVMLTDASNNFTATNVEGAMNELFQNVSDGKQLVASAITGIGQSASGGDTFVTLANKINAVPRKAAQTYAPSTSSRTITSGQYLSGTQTISPITGNATTAQVLSGQTFNSASAGIAQSGTMVNRGAVTNTITTQGGSYTIPVGYHSGSGKVTVSFSNLSAGNIKKGVNIGGVVGTLEPIPPKLVLFNNTSGESKLVVSHGNGDNWGGPTFSKTSSVPLTYRLRSTTNVSHIEKNYILFSSASKIDVTNYKTVHINVTGAILTDEVDNPKLNVRLLLSNASTGEAYVSRIITKSTAGTHSIDISAYSGSYYVTLYFSYGGFSSWSDDDKTKAYLEATLYDFFLEP